MMGELLIKKYGDVKSEGTRIIKLDDCKLQSYRPVKIDFKFYLFLLVRMDLNGSFT